MLFNSPEFLFVFLPVALLCVGIGQSLRGKKASSYALILTSIVFYGYWRPSELLVIAASICFNFLLAHVLMRSPGLGKVLITIGVGGNLGALAYYKYYNFMVGWTFNLFNIKFTQTYTFHPLGISFYSFQQIAFLVDIYRLKIREIGFREYVLSVLFFPHLIAGPLLHYTKTIPQFRSLLTVNSATIWAGLPLFSIGLAKKVLVADSLSPIVSQLFSKAQVAPLEFFSAWFACLGYTAQLYFDFSGYADMAIGLGIMFNITLPINFNSPYKSASIIEFWRRWHMTLSEFLRQYLYFPLGGSRVRSSFRRYANLMLVMLLGGLWHGAGWTFVFWGGLHGAYLIINHYWRHFLARRASIGLSKASARLAVPVTFLSVALAWVFFRASDFRAAINVLSGMFGQTYISLPGELAYVIGLHGNVFDGRGMLYIDLVPGSIILLIAYVIVFKFPNTSQIFELDGRPRDWARQFEPQQIWPRLVSVSILLWAACFGIIGSVPSEFIYFQF
jgi:D-alanyl-lipoteichoic acid acyltransferase DltB (MBOAT superfamily)